MKSTNPFCYTEPVWHAGHYLWVEDPIVPKIVNDMLMRKCCLIMGPPNSGTTSTLLAVQEAYKRKQPSSVWWNLDLEKFHFEKSEDFLNELAVDVNKIFPDQPSIRSGFYNVDEFAQMLLDLLGKTHRILVIAIDHIESVSFNVAALVVRLVRLLYTQRGYGNQPEQLVVALIAGSRRLMRQGNSKGSPLNFAEKHYVNDWEIDSAAQSLLNLSKEWIWTFSPDAAYLLASMTGGDRYLLQRIGFDCVQLTSLAGSSLISEDLIKQVVDRFVEVGFLDDANLLNLIPDLIKDADTMELVLALLGNEPELVPVSQLQRIHPTTSVTQLFSAKLGFLTIRNQIYNRILYKYKPIIYSAYTTLSQANYRLDCLRELQSTISAFEYNSSDKAMLRIMDRIKSLSLATSVHLLIYDKENKEMQVLGSSQQSTRGHVVPWELSRQFVETFQPDIDRVPCPIVEQCQKNICLNGSDDHCFWMPLRAPGSVDFIGALAISGQSLVMSPASERELSEICKALAGATRRQSQFAGIRELSELPLDLSEDSFQYEICRIAALLFNKPYAFFWAGLKSKYHVSLKASVGLEQEQKICSGFVLPEEMLEALKDAKPFIAVRAVEESDNDPLSTSLKNIGCKQLLLICFSMPDSQILILGIGSINSWELSDDENTIAQLLGKQVQVILANQVAYHQIERRLEISRISIPLLSHELNRAPAAIAEEAELLQNELLGGLTQTQHEAINKIRTYALHHHELVRKLIDFTKLDSGAYRANLQTGPIGQTLITILRKIKLAMEGQGSRLQVKIPINLPVHRVDHFLLERILSNLVQNAIDHTPPESIIRVHAWTDKKYTLIAIEDDGLGIPEEARGKIFEAWKRGPRTDQANGPLGNLGIGLFLVKQMMEIMDGSVAYDDEYTSGARFVIKFPINEVEQNETL